MERKKLAVLLIVVISGGVFSVFLVNQLFFSFNPGDRYEWQTLDYMNVPFTNKSYINSWNEGYSETASAPWGFAHNGLDFFFNDSAPVIAMTPGQVQAIEFREFDEPVNKYHIKLHIRFNSEIVLVYGFEPWTNVESEAKVQQNKLSISVGDWVALGDNLAEFVAYEGSAHIHLDFLLNNNQICPKTYFSTEGYNKMMDMIQTFHPTWELCY